MGSTLISFIFGYLAIGILCNPAAPLAVGIIFSVIASAVAIIALISLVLFLRTLILDQMYSAANKTLLALDKCLFFGNSAKSNSETGLTKTTNDNFDDQLEDSSNLNVEEEGQNQCAFM